MILIGTAPEAIGKLIPDADGDKRLGATWSDTGGFFTDAFEERDERRGDEIFPEKDFAAFSITGFAVHFHGLCIFGSGE